MLVDVLACNDGLEAKLSIRDFNPGAWQKLFPSKENLVSFLVSKGIVPDLIENVAVESVCTLLSDVSTDAQIALNLKEAQSLIVASGSAPEPEEAEGMMFHKSYLSNPREIETLDHKLQEADGEQTMKAMDPQLQVEEGQIILSFLTIRNGTPGRNIFGKVIPFRPYTAALPAVGRGIVKLENKWVAQDPGILVLLNNTLLVLGPGGTQPGAIRVSEDKLKVWLVLQQSSMSRGHDPRMALNSVKSLMARMGLQPMQEEERVFKALEAFLRGGADQEVLLVQAVGPRPGKNGSIELLVDPEPDLPDAEAVKNVDFKDFTFFRTVAAGDRLARILPPVPGVAGMDVYGNISMPKAGVPITVKPGRNTEFAPDNPDIILASKSGKLLVEDGIPYVVDTLKVTEDVSFKTGNLKFPGAIEVNGNVLDKFAIEAKGDVGIGGVVENGVVVSEGSIIIKGGVIGDGTGIIKSKLSSVTIGYIRNQRIESHSNIVVYNEVLNAQLFAKKSVLMRSKSNSVIGGHLVAYDGIEIYNAGNEAGTKTILEVGKDFEIEAELLRKRESLKAVRTDIEFLEKKREKLDVIVRWESGRNPENRLLEQRVKGVLKFLEKLRQVLNSKINELESALY
ncbi:MAG TPA: FapA family protein, partial [Fibrobacteria bacterium]|nr:FapA family protein [Fibrobacteria bacterium]